MANGYVPVQGATAPDLNMDTERITIAGVVVERERVQVGGTASGELAAVTSAAPASNAYGLHVRLVGNASNEILAKISDTLTVGSHAVTNAGTFAVQVDGAALTALQLIDDTVKADDAGFTMASDKVMMAGFVYDDVAPDSVDEGDAGAARMSGNRNQYMQIRDGATGAERGAAVNASGELSVKVADSLTVGTHAVTQSGTWNVGTVTTVSAVTAITNALPAGNNNIGDVDIASIAAGDNNIGNVDLASAIPAGTNKIGGVDLDSDATPGSAVPSVAQYVAGNDGGTARAIKTDSSGELQVDVLNTVTVGSHAVTNAGTFVTQVDGAALTALQLIDDPVVQDDNAFTPGTTKVHMAGFEYDDTGPDSVDEGDAGAARMSANRNQYVQIRDNAGNERGANVNSSGELNVKVADTLTVGSHAVTNAGTFLVQNNAATPAGSNVIGAVVSEIEGSLVRHQGSTATIKFFGLTATASGTVTLVASATTKIRLLSYSIVTRDACAVQLIDSAGSTISGLHAYAANGGITESFVQGLGETATGRALQLAGATATGSIGIRGTYLTV